MRAVTCVASCDSHHEGPPPKAGSCPPASPSSEVPPPRSPRHGRACWCHPGPTPGPPLHPNPEKGHQGHDGCEVSQGHASQLHSGFNHVAGVRHDVSTGEAKGRARRTQKVSELVRPLPYKSKMTSKYKVKTLMASKDVTSDAPAAQRTRRGVGVGGAT